MKIKMTLLAMLLFTHHGLWCAEITPEKRIEIDKMLKLVGTEKLVEQMMSQMIAGLRPGMKDVSDDFWDRFAGKMHASELIEMIVPLYDKYYSLEDLRAANTFYSSPAGQRLLSTMPQLMKESMAIGQKWGAKIGQQAAEDAKAEKQAKDDSK